MKRIFMLLVSFLLSANIFTASADNQQKDPFLTRSFPASTIKDVEVATSGGSITVNGDASAEAIIEVFVTRDGWRDRWSAEKIKEMLDEHYTLDIKVENGTLYATAKRKPSFSMSGSSLSISFRISVPNRVNSKLNTSGGSIHISGLTGSQDFKASGGSLHIENLSGNISGRTSGGSITVTGSNDNIDLATSGGSITAKECSGKIVLKTSGGSLKLSDLNGNIDAATSGGSINASNVSGTLKTGTSGGSVKIGQASGNVDARTSGGSMTVEMDSVNEYVKLSNSGNMNLTLPEGNGYNLNIQANKIETSGLNNFRGNMESKKLEGTVGNGGPDIEVKSSQRVNLSFK